MAGVVGRAMGRPARLLAAVLSIEPTNRRTEDTLPQRTIVEQLNARLKDEFGGRTIYYKGATEIMTHLMFGVAALTVDQLLRLVT